MSTRWMPAAQLAELVGPAPLSRPIHQDTRQSPPAARHRRAVGRRRSATQRARTGDEARDQPVDRDRRVRGPARRRMPRSPPGLGQLRPGQPDGSGQPAFPRRTAGGRRRHHHDLQRRGRHPRAGRGLRPCARRTPPADLRPRLFSRRAARPARAAGRAVHRSRTADRPLPADHHQRRARGDQPGRAHRPGARGSGAGRVTELPQRAGVVPPAQRSTGAGTDDGDRMGPRRHLLGHPAVRSAAGLPHPRLPQPDRSRCWTPATAASSVRRCGATAASRWSTRRSSNSASTDGDASAVRGRQSGDDHRRLGQQGVLGRAADRLDPGTQGVGATAGRKPGQCRSRSGAGRATGTGRAARTG